MRVPTLTGFEKMRRSPLVVLGFLIIFAVAAYKSANYVIADDMTGLSFVALAFVGCAFIVAMLNNRRNGLYFFLTWLLFEDFARKYLGNNMAIYFAKDILAAVVFLSSWPTGESRSPRSGLPSSCRFCCLCGSE